VPTRPNPQCPVIVAPRLSYVKCNRSLTRVKGNTAWCPPGAHRGAVALGIVPIDPRIPIRAGQFPQGDLGSHRIDKFWTSPSDQLDEGADLAEPPTAGLGAG
jgi:hypothetical protein